jgi:SAM-dependent methyltransferase
MNNKKPWHDDDELWETVEPLLFHTEQMERAPEEVDRIISLLELEPPLKILDLACGVGRHSIEFAKRGYDVVGVDRTEIYLDRAKEIATSEGVNVEFVKDDMREFVRENEFDLAVNLWTSFSYFEDLEEDRKVLENVYKSLNDRGKFVIQMMGKEVLARIFQKRSWREVEGVLLLEEREVRKDWSWMYNRLIIIKDGVRKDLEFSHRLYSAVELKTMMSEVGFSKINVYGDFMGSDYDQNAGRMVMVSIK